MISRHGLHEGRKMQRRPRRFDHNDGYSKYPITSHVISTSLFTTAAMLEIKTESQIEIRHVYEYVYQAMLCNNRPGQRTAYYSETLID